MLHQRPGPEHDPHDIGLSGRGPRYIRFTHTAAEVRGQRWAGTLAWYKSHPGGGAKTASVTFFHVALRPRRRDDLLGTASVSDAHTLLFMLRVGRPGRLRWKKKKTQLVSVKPPSRSNAVSLMCI